MLALVPIDPDDWRWRCINGHWVPWKWRICRECWDYRDEQLDLYLQEVLRRQSADAEDLPALKRAVA